MTIKNRLFLSNLLMIVIPFVISFSVYIGGLYMVSFITGVSPNKRPPDGSRFVQLVKEVKQMSIEYSRSRDYASMIASVEQMNDQIKDGGFAVYVYEGQSPVIRQEVYETNPALQAALSSDQDSVMLFGRMGVFASRVGDYQIVLLDNHYSMRDSYSFNYRVIVGRITLLSFVCSIIMILITNSMLTRFVFRKILHPLRVLAEGVQQISEGNLEYRIRYDGKDEFAPVCSAFNAMAEKLQELIKTIERDQESRRELIAGISHDLRTPLTAIKAYVEGFQQGVASTPEAQKKYLEIIKNKADDLEHIINMLFTFSKMDVSDAPYNIQKLNLFAVVSDIVEDYKEEYNAKGLEIVFEADSKDVPVCIDADQLKYAVINIFENTVKYSDKGHSYIKISLKEEEMRAILRLTDDGPGVPAEALDKLFDVFYRSDPSRSNPGKKGSGLGLAIVSKYVRKLGGDIKAENAPQGGLSIIMTIPKCVKETGEKLE